MKALLKSVTVPAGDPTSIAFGIAQLPDLSEVRFVGGGSDLLVARERLELGEEIWIELEDWQITGWEPPGGVAIPDPPTVVTPGTFVIPFALRDPGSDDEGVTWLATVSWSGGPVASFTMEMPPGQSMSEPLDMWASWLGEGLLVAWADRDSGSHGAVLIDVELDDAADASDPAWWQHLAELALGAHVYHEDEPRRISD